MTRETNHELNREMNHEATRETTGETTRETAPDKYQWLVDQIPDYENFLTVDELDRNSRQLAADYPDIVELQELTTSPEGRPIYCLTIGEGDKVALLFGSPHPNEPAGSMMLDFFARALAENEELRRGFRWHIIKTLDVDATALNEPWFKAPTSLRDYAHDYYRSTGYENTEWTYPLDYKSHRFQQLLGRYDYLHTFIKTQKPTLIFSFHSTDFGPSCWYPRDTARNIWDALYAVNLKHELPFYQVDNDLYNIPPFAPGHFLHFQERRSPSGYSAEGAVEAADFTNLLVSEMPRFLEPRAGDETYLDYLRGEAARENAEQGFLFGELLASLYSPIAPYVSDDNPYAKMVVERYEFYRDHYESRLRHIDINPIYRDRCKVTEAFFNYELPKFHRLVYWALLRRSCEFELAKGDVPGRKILEKVQSEAERHFDDAASEVEKSLQYTAIPIRKLISVPLEATMILVDHMRNNMQNN